MYSFDSVLSVNSEIYKYLYIDVRQIHVTSHPCQNKS